ncbi:MAG: DUF4825 domain-containing protein, partial [Eubacteriales bacterium]
QRQYFMTHDTKNIQMRIKTIQNIKQWITQNEDKIIIALKKDLNKHATESYMAEIGLVLSEINYQLKHIKRWSKNKKVWTPLAQFYGVSYETYEPYGVTLEYKDLSRIPEMELKGNAYLMFCLIENLGQVTFNDQTAKTSVQFLRGDVLEYGNTAEFFAENKEQFISFANRLNDEILKTE